MPHLAPPTLTAAEQKAILHNTAANVRRERRRPRIDRADHMPLIFSRM